MQSSHLLQRLSLVGSPSGYEGNIRSLLKTIVSPFIDCCKEDVLGNLICYKHSLSPNCNTLMFVAHMDEIGLMVSYIEESGYIRFTRIGGVDLMLLPGRSVNIIHNGTVVTGVIGAKPYHMKKHSVSCEPDESELWIDIGASRKEDAEKKVSIGDCVVIDSSFTKLSDNLSVSRGCDDKAGVVALVNMLELIKDDRFNCEIVVVFSVQEEVGLRGAKTASYCVSPDICIAVDVEHATDYPNINRAKYGDIRIGYGPVIPYCSDLSNAVQNSLRQISTQKGIAFQQLALPASSGTDANVVQLTKKGCATGLVSIPCRYMHTPVELISLSDVDSISIILAEFCKQYCDAN